MIAPRTSGTAAPKSRRPNRVNRLLAREYQDRWRAAESLVLLGDRGLAAQESFQFRCAVRQRQLRVRMVKNRIARLAFQEMKNVDLAPVLAGQALFLDGGDGVTCAKAALELLKQFGGKLELLGGFLEGELVDKEGVERFARMPPREEMLGRLVGQIAAVGGAIVSLLRGPGGRIASALRERAKAIPPGTGGAETPPGTA